MKKGDVHETKSAAIYHVMRSGEGFHETATTLHALVRKAIVEHPGKPRHLFLDIEGHRNPEGGFDSDAYELQKEFVIGFLGAHLTEIRQPLFVGRNSDRQSDDLCEVLHIVTPNGASC